MVAKQSNYSKETVMQDIIDNFVESLLSLDRLAVKLEMDRQVRRVPPIQFVEQVVGTALELIGDRWQAGSLALSQVYMAGRICEELVDEILPPADPVRKNQPRLAVCVLMDHHRLGKNITYSLLRASGYELSDYGRVEVDELVKRVNNDRIEILLISTLMLPSALKIRQVRESLSEPVPKIIVGGAPFRFDDQLWHEVGADIMCLSASEAIMAIKSVMGDAAR